MIGTLGGWGHLLHVPCRIECSKMELIGYDFEEPFICGPGYIDIKSNNEIQFFIYGVAKDFHSSLKKIRKTRENRFEPLEQFRLIATDYSGVEWNGGYTSVEYFADSNLEAFPLKGELSALLTSDEGEFVVTESGVELAFSPIPNIPMDRNQVTTTSVDGDVLARHFRPGKYTVPILDTEIVLWADVSDNALYVSANTSKALPHPYLENWLAEPFRILLGGAIYPRLVARNTGEKRAHISLRNAPRDRIPSYIGLASESMLNDEARFWDAYVLILQIIARDCGFESHQITSFYSEISMASLGSNWVFSMTLASTIEALAKLLMTEKDKTNEFNNEDIEDMKSHLKKWNGDEGIKKRMLSSLAYLNQRSPGAYLKSLPEDGGITMQQFATWRTVRNSVMHGELVEPWATEENEQRVNDLVALVHSLTWLVLKSRNSASPSAQ